MPETRPEPDDDAGSDGLHAESIAHESLASV